MNNPIEKWFGDDFAKLHPLIQKLHHEGGKLTGEVDISYGNGIAGLIGRRLAKKLGIPTNKKANTLQVNIRHSSEALHWDRTFNGSHKVKSVFVPNGRYPAGSWTENSGNVSLVLRVEVIDGGWHWVQQAISLKGLSLPLWLFPKTTAYKSVRDGKYIFSVSFSLPVLGHLMSYSGQLVAS